MPITYGKIRDRFRRAQALRDRHSPPQDSKRSAIRVPQRLSRCGAAATMPLYVAKKESMVRFDLAYGRGACRSTFRKRTSSERWRRVRWPARISRSAFAEAWAHPFGMSDPAASFRRGETVVVVVTDHTRKTPTRLVFPLLWERLKTGSPART